MCGYIILHSKLSIGYASSLVGFCIRERWWWIQ